MFDLMPFHHRHRLRRLGDEIEECVERFLGDEVFSLSGRGFRTDIRETENEYIIEAELPGFDKDNIEIELHDNRLTISAQKDEIKEEEEENYIRRERRSGSFKRSFYMDNIDPDKVDAKYENGILKITLGKKEPGKGKKRKIDIR